MMMSIIIPAVVTAFVVFMLGQLKSGKDGKPVPFRKKVEIYSVLLFVGLLGVAYFYLKLISDGLL